MSATRWTKCPNPNCGKSIRSEYAHQESGDFREDYEVYFEDSKFKIYYGGVCCGRDGNNPKNGCGFKMSFKYDEVMIFPKAQEQNND